MRTGADLKFQAFAEPLRLRILLLLRGGELCVCDLVTVLQVPQPTASRHLAHLRRAGLVTVRKAGFWTYYSLCAPANPFHAMLLASLDHCLVEAPELQADLDQAAKIREAGDCCP